MKPALRMKGPDLPAFPHYLFELQWEETKKVVMKYGFNYRSGEGLAIRLRSWQVGYRLNILLLAGMKSKPMFRNRIEAGRMLAKRLKQYAHSPGVVLAISRGDVPIGYAVAKALNLPLDLLLSRKIR